MGFCVIPLDYLVKSVNWGKNNIPQMVTHLSIVHGLDCLTSVIWPFTLTALTFGLCWKCADLMHWGRWRSYYPLVKKPTKFTAHPSLKCLIFAQYQHEPKVKSVRLNGKITEVKQLRPWAIDTKMGDHLGDYYFSQFYWFCYLVYLF